MFFSTMSEKSITICLYADENNPKGLKKEKRLVIHGEME